MHEMQAKYAEKELQIITVDLDSEQSLAEEFLHLTSSQFPIVYDAEGHIAFAYQVVGIPRSYLIDRSGNLRQSHKVFLLRNKPSC
jgi:peroxiredoxin